MKITEWFARAVAAGLMPECKEITAIFLKISGDYFWVITGGNSWQDMKTYYSIPSDLVSESNDKKITLHSNGKDLYSLEWRKPTKQDVGKMCWLLTIDSFDGKVIMLISLAEEDLYSEFSYQILLADHGQIAPTEADFLKVYGDDND
jgi:hypothetical protein